MSELEHEGLNDASIVVWGGIVCRFDVVKSFARREDLRYADYNEIRDYYYRKLTC